MLNYSQGNSHPEMSMAVYQTARLYNNPMLSHEKYIERLGRYLLHTKKEGIIYNPDISKGLECYVDADFVEILGCRRGTPRWAGDILW